ncbi:hypothetical protein TNCV_4925351 [Trichonephila clavipes]|nr:hypothetical protein TNCV_4925351 [Trichonephila clavipes]
MRHSRTPNTVVFPLSSASCHPKLSLLEAEPSLEHYSQKSCTLDIFQPSLSAISRKENPPSHSSITQPRSNSARC